jgi:RNA processing factor Prp31
MVSATSKKGKDAEIKWSGKLCQECVNKYRVNSDDKIMMVTTPKIVDAFMRNISKSFDILDEKFISWYNSGFPETGRVYDRSLDHYQLVKLARDIVKEKLCTS